MVAFDEESRFAMFTYLSEVSFGNLSLMRYAMTLQSASVRRLPRFFNLNNGFSVTLGGDLTLNEGNDLPSTVNNVLSTVQKRRIKFIHIRHILSAYAAQDYPQLHVAAAAT